MQRRSFRITVIAETGERFAGFAPYAASVNDSGVVAFQAALRGGATGVFAGSGGAVTTVAETRGGGPVERFVSHPDVDERGRVCVYAEPRAGGQGVHRVGSGGVVALAEPGERFASVGPLGPTMNDAGAVAFRADTRAGAHGVFLARAVGVDAVADTRRFARFHGLPVVDAAGRVVFRADLPDGRQGVYAWRDGVVRVVVETGARFEELGGFPSAGDDGSVGFAARLRGGGSGVFVATAGGEAVAVVEDGAGLESFRGVLLNRSGVVVFYATPRAGTLGIYGGPDPVADRVLGIGDVVDGTRVAELALNPVSVNEGGQVAVRVGLEDGRGRIVRLDPVG